MMVADRVQHACNSSMHWKLKGRHASARTANNNTEPDLLVYRCHARLKAVDFPYDLCSEALPQSHKHNLGNCSMIDSLLEAQGKPARLTK